MAAIFVSSAQSRVLASGPDWGLHAAAYLVLALLLARALGPGAQNLPGVLAVAGLCALYGLSDEWHQSFVPGRQAQASDVLMDSVGGLVGAFLYRRRRSSDHRASLPLHGEG